MMMMMMVGLGEEEEGRGRLSTMFFTNREIENKRKTKVQFERTCVGFKMGKNEI